jgi:hypothetical protein
MLLRCNDGIPRKPSADFSTRRVTLTHQHHLELPKGSTRSCIISPACRQAKNRRRVSYKSFASVDSFIGSRKEEASVGLDTVALSLNVARIARNFLLSFHPSWHFGPLHCITSASHWRMQNQVVQNQRFLASA